VAPAVTLTRSVAPAHPAGIDPTVTDATLDPDRFCSTLNPVFVQRPVEADPAPRDALENEIDAANATAAPTTMPTRPQKRRYGASAWLSPHRSSS